MARAKERSDSFGGGDGARQRPAPPRPQKFWRTLTRIFRYLKNSKGTLALAMAMLLISSVSSISGSMFLRPLINDYILPGDFAGLFRGLAVLGCIYLAGVAAGYVQMRSTINLAQKTVKLMRRDMFDKLQSLPLRYHDSHTHGELMSRFTNDADNVLTLLEQGLGQLLSSAVMFVGVLGCMVFLSPLMFLATLLVIGLMLLVVRIMGGKSRKRFQSQQKILGDLNGNIEETIGGLREIKAFNHEQASWREFEKLNGAFMDTAKSANFLAGAMMPIMVNLNNVSYAFSAVFGGILTALGMFDLGSLASYLQFSRQVGQPINQISSQLNNVYAAVAGAERIFALMDEEPEIDEGKVALVRDQADSWHWRHPDGSVTPLRGDVRFHNVSFSYEEDKPVLKDVSLYAKPGQMIAFVGSTGAGKTTITNLINRFYDVGDGSITYDGIDVRQIQKDSLRASLGMVLQDTHLFTDTVMGNIRYGRPDATDEECIEAARKANAHSFIRRLPKGYDTMLSGDGGNLSQGQRQLIAIARAYISQPPVMILDEATSSIDTRTERLVQQGMSQLMEGRTVFVIAHRLSTVREAKAIIVLEHGEIIERGSHQELLELGGRYYQLHSGFAQLD